MHPNKVFDWTDPAEMLSFADRQAFSHIFTASDAGQFVVHAPVMVTDNGKVWFHVARRNRIADHLVNRPVLISISGREGYQSANWYVADNQVPTWHYEAVEIEGVARPLTDDGLVTLLDGLSQRHEGRLSPENPWTRAKMGPGKFEAMLKAIIGFEVDPVEIRGTRKFNQHKPADDLSATIEGQLHSGRDDIVAAIGEVMGR